LFCVGSDLYQCNSGNAQNGVPHEIVSDLASVTDDICKALQDNDGRPLNPEMKEALAKRVLELFENGVTNPDDLRIAIMTDSLWASSRGVISLKEVPFIRNRGQPKLRRSAEEIGGEILFLRSRSGGRWPARFDGPRRHKISANNRIDLVIEGTAESLSFDDALRATGKI
jgi:hypothetical protein